MQLHSIFDKVNVCKTCNVTNAIITILAAFSTFQWFSKLILHCMCKHLINICISIMPICNWTIRLIIKPQVLFFEEYYSEKHWMRCNPTHVHVTNERYIRCSSLPKRPTSKTYLFYCFFVLFVHWESVDYDTSYECTQSVETHLVVMSV